MSAPQPAETSDRGLRLVMMETQIMEMDARMLVRLRLDILALGPLMLSLHVFLFVETERESEQNSAMTATLPKLMEAV
jgi:hypothetical protein